MDKYEFLERIETIWAKQAELQANLQREQRQFLLDFLSIPDFTNTSSDKENVIEPVSHQENTRTITLNQIVHQMGYKSVTLDQLSKLGKHIKTRFPTVGKTKEFINGVEYTVNLYPDNKNDLSLAGAVIDFLNSL